MDITYKIEFFSEWHCGSGLSAGADTDALVIKDSEGFPYIPGKTLKGLFREAIEELIELKDTSTEIEKKLSKTRSDISPTIKQKERKEVSSLPTPNWN